MNRSTRLGRPGVSTRCPIGGSRLFARHGRERGRLVGADRLACARGLHGTRWRSGVRRRCLLHRCARSCRNSTLHGSRAVREPGLERIDALRERLDRELRLGSRQAGEGDLEHQARIGRVAHAECSVIEHRERPRDPVAALERGGLGLERPGIVLAPLEKRRAAPGHAHHVDIAHVRHQVARELEQVVALVDLVGDQPEEPHHVTLGDAVHELAEHRARHLAQKRARVVRAHGAVAEHAQLLERGEGVAHAAAGMARHDADGLVVELKALLLAHVAQAALDVLVADTVEIEPLAAREDRLEDLLRVGGAEHEDHMRRGLLERLEQRVERRRGEHVDLVDDVDLVLAAHRGEVHRADDLLAHVVHARAARGVELVHVRMVALGDELALLAGAVGHAARGPLLARGIGALAEQGLGEDARHGRLARAARAAEQVGMREAPLADGMLERGDDVLLPHDGVEGERAVFAVERFHGTSLIRKSNAPMIASGGRARAPVGRGLARGAAAPRRICEHALNRHRPTPNVLDLSEKHDSRAGPAARETNFKRTEESHAALPAT